MRRINPMQGMVLALLGGVVLLSGCSSDSPPPDAAATSAGPASPSAQAQPEKKGNVMDTSATPAPSGVKTGLEGGGANRK